MNALCLFEAKSPSFSSFMAIMHALLIYISLLTLADALVSNIRTILALYINNNARIYFILARQYRFTLVWYFNVRKADNCEYRTYAQS